MFGIFKMEVQYQQEKAEFYFMMMDNVQRLVNPSRLRFVFDLKGSEVNRHVPVSEDSKPSMTLKD
jgi:hypothetical protein